MRNLESGQLEVLSALAHSWLGQLSEAVTWLLCQVPKPTLAP